MLRKRRPTLRRLSTVYCRLRVICTYCTILLLQGAVLKNHRFCKKSPPIKAATPERAAPKQVHEHSSYGSYDAVPSKEVMDIRLAQGLRFPGAEGYSDPDDDSSEEDDVRYAPPAAPCPGCTAPEPCLGRPWRRHLTAVGDSVGVRHLLPFHYQFPDDRVGMRVRCHGGQLRYDVEKTRLHREHLTGIITGWTVVPGPTGRGPPIATDGWESLVYTVKLSSAQEGGGLDHSKLKQTIPERDIEFEVCLMPDPGDAGAIAAWLQERFPSTPRDRYPRSRPLTACDVREVAARFRGLWRDQDELYGRLAATATAAVAVPPPPAGGAGLIAPTTGCAKNRGKRQPAPDQSVSGRQTGGPLSSWPSTLPPQTATEPTVAPGSPPSVASVLLPPSPGRDPRSQKRAKDRGKRQPAPDQPVSGRQTGGLLSSWPSTLPPQTATEPTVAPGSPPSMASVPLLSSPGRDPRSQKRAKDRGKRQPAHGQSVSGKHHSRLEAMLSPSVAPKLHPAALSPADVALFPTFPGAAEGSEMGNPAPSYPQAEGHPGNSLRGLLARPAALY